MDGLYRSIELPDPTNYGLTSELKPKQKAEASIMARASTASEGHNWRLKVFARALILMEGNQFPGKASPYWHNYYLYEIQFISARPFSYNWLAYGRIWIMPEPVWRIWITAGQ